MKTPGTAICQMVAPIFLLAALAPAAFAPPIYSYVPARETYNRLTSADSVFGPFTNSYAGDATNDVGAFSAGDTSATPGGQTFVTAQSSCLQDSLITASVSSLSITGVVQVAGSGGASLAGANSGSAGWDAYSRITVSINTSQPFSYSLQAATLFATNQLESSPAAYLVLSRPGYPDVAAFGSSRLPGYTSLPAAGTSSGTLPAGSYQFHAEAGESGGVDPLHSPAAENFSVSFNLNIASVPPQPPVITALTPNGAGAFFLIWNAFQAGNYRVLSSSNLTDWGEYVPSAGRPSGPNTNAVNVLPGGANGYFRVQYLP